MLTKLSKPFYRSYLIFTHTNKKNNRGKNDYPFYK